MNRRSYNKIKTGKNKYVKKMKIHEIKIYI